MVLANQKQPTVTVLSSLLAIEDALHHIPQEAIEETATFCEVTVNEVWSVACYYTNFRFTKPGKYTLDICWGPTCHLKGAQKIMKAVHKQLGVKGEETNANGTVTLRYSTCLGACAHAPVLAVNHKLQGKASVEGAAKLAKKLADGEE